MHLVDLRPVVLQICGQQARRYSRAQGTEKCQAPEAASVARGTQDGGVIPMQPRDSLASSCRLHPALVLLNRAWKVGLARLRGRSAAPSVLVDVAAKDDV